MIHIICTDHTIIRAGYTGCPTFIVVPHFFSNGGFLSAELKVEFSLERTCRGRPSFLNIFLIYSNIFITRLV